VYLGKADHTIVPLKKYASVRPRSGVSSTFCTMFTSNIFTHSDGRARRLVLIYLQMAPVERGYAFYNRELVENGGSRVSALLLTSRLGFVFAQNVRCFRLMLQDL